MFGRRPNTVVPLPPGRAPREPEGRRPQPGQAEAAFEPAAVPPGRVDEATRLEDERRSVTAALAGEPGILEKVDLDAAVQKILPAARKRIELSEVLRISRGNLANMMSDVVDVVCNSDAIALDTNEVSNT
ncbi:MAG TPA: hypothetical protein VLR47_11935, partial [Rhodospirillales bacterium]|nr:hypothetical protein [Rhodospirillales bacterium]